MTERISNAISSIESTIRPHLGELRHGLLNGANGVALFYAYKYLLERHQRDRDTAINLIDQSIEDANENLTTTTFGRGLAGVVWSVCHLRNIGVLETDTDFGESIEAFIEQIDTELARDNYDQFNGFIGYAMVLMEDNPVAHRAVINKIISWLVDKAQSRQDGSYWIDPVRGHGQQIDLGTPHGMVGICLFMLACLESGVCDNPDAVKACLHRSSKWAFERFKIVGSEFLPYQWNLTDPNSDDVKGRLAWCYGNMSLAYLMYRLDNVCGVNCHSSNALELMDRVTTLDVENAGVDFIDSLGFYDTALCHGSGGVYLIFKRLLDASKEQRYRKSAENWLAETLKLVEKQTVKFPWLTTEHHGINEDCGFLNGLAGTGLSLITAVDDTKRGWERMLLL